MVLPDVVSHEQFVMPDNRADEKFYACTRLPIAKSDSEGDLSNDRQVGPRSFTFVSCPNHDHFNEVCQHFSNPLSPAGKSFPVLLTSLLSLIG